MTDDVLTFTKNRLLSALKPREPDVAIALGQEPSSLGDNRLWLHGAYQVNEAYAKSLNVPMLLKALIITAVSDDMNITKNLVGEAILFEDDETVINGMNSGYFNYDLTGWLSLHERRTYLVTVSLGHFISNTVQVEVNPIPFSG